MAYARTLSATLALAFISWAASPANATDPGSAAARFEPVECWSKVADETRTECGYLQVPERWDAPSERQIRLSVAIFPNEDADQQQAAPVIFLAGGPGVTTAIDQPTTRANWRDFADRALAGRDIVVFEQRGARLSRPHLDCPEIADLRIWADVSDSPEEFGDPATREKAALTACHERLRREGHDLTAFNSRQSAADIDALRAALGYDKIIPFGVSYGTHLALTFMRHYPGRVAAAVLDSVLFAPDKQRNWVVGNAAFAFERLLAACAKLQDCNRAYPELPLTLLGLLDRLAREPLVVEVLNLMDSRPLYARIDDKGLLAVLFTALYSNQKITNLPMVIDGLAQGQTYLIVPLVEDRLYHPFSRNAAAGMNLSVACHEFFSLERTRRQVPGGLTSHLEAWAEQRWREDPCRYWPSGHASAGERSAVQSDAPTLLLSGAFDPVTPVEAAERASATLPNSYSFVFPATGHGQVSSDRCAYQVFVDFLADPNRRPAPACLGNMRQPSFLALGSR